MLAKLVERLFGCSHIDYSFPITIKAERPRGSHAPKGTYVVCLDCGRELPYDWSAMRVRANQNRTWSGIAETVTQ
jgi:hypothetical protein